MKKLYVIWLLLLTAACRETEVVPDALLTFSVEGETAVVDHQHASIRIELGENTLWDSLKINFTATGGAILEAGGKTISPGSILSLSDVDHLNLKSVNGTSKTYTLLKSSVFEAFGMGKIQEYRGSLGRKYSFYYDQYGSGLHQYINCGPAVATMALKWRDSTFAYSVADARNAVLPDGGWWYTTTIYDYLRANGVSPAYIPLPSSESVADFETHIRTAIDREYLLILCLDMFYVKQNENPTERTNRFYTAGSQGWGHFLLVKGYTLIDGKMWLEIHDPYSIGQKYADGQLKGNRRYYDPVEIKKATDVWWPYAMLVPQKSGTLPARLRTVKGHVPPQKGKGFFR